MTASVPDNMRAAVYRGSSVVTVDEVHTPEIGAGEILIRVEACGVCHTDLKKIEKMIALIQNTDVTELELEEEGVKIRLCRGGHAPQTIQTFVAPPAPQPIATPAAPIEDNKDTAPATPPQHFVRSPMVGTLYTAVCGNRQDR